MEKEKIKIVGGHSGAHKISIMSEDFIATAHFDSKTKRISTEVKPQTALWKFLRQKKLIFLPRAVTMILFLMSHLRTSTIFAIGATIIAMVVIDIINFPVSSAVSGGPSIQSIAVQCLFLYLFYDYTRKIAPWHGAEHMAIAAYEKKQSSEIKDIFKEDPVNPHCGGRYFLPLIFGSYIFIPILSSALHLGPTISLLIYFEVVLQIDKLLGFDKIPVFSHFSTWLQRYVTTAPPTSREVHTAKAAMDEIIKAHNG